MIPYNQNISTFRPVPGFYDDIDDPELQTLGQLLEQRLSSVREARDTAALLQILKDRMEEDIVHFYYDKTSGEHRSAYGTRCPDIIRQYGGEPSGDGRENSFRTFVYYDLMRQAWRSFRPENFVQIDHNYTI